MERKNSNLQLLQRAKLLAVQEVAESKSDHFLFSLEFILGDERYAVEAKYIREVFSFKDVSILPNVPAFIYGLINVRRKIVSIVDLRQLFDLPIKKNKIISKTIILEQGEMEFGILVEEIVGLKKISVNALQNHMPNLTKIGHELLKGITNDRLILLDGNKLLNASAILVSSQGEV